MNEIRTAIAIVKERNFCNGCTTADTRGLENCTVCDRYIARNTTIQALQEKAERDNPVALTLEELKQMVGEPVWCVVPSRKYIGQVLIANITSREIEDVDIKFPYYLARDLSEIETGKVIYYRHKPKILGNEGR